jgi:hypothetical protein
MINFKEAGRVQLRRITLILLAFLAVAVVIKASYATEERNIIEPRKQTFINQAYQIYNQIDFSKYEKPDKLVFARAYFGYENLKNAGYLSTKKHTLTICDFSLSANQPRLWVIDLDAKKILFNTLVAHGQGSGEEYATSFSNRENSHQSSLGFYVTAETYEGDHGYSLRLQGMDKGYNDRAYDRSIVMHGADYVSNDFIDDNQRLGRSWGCPAVPVKLATPIINIIKNGTCLFIYYPDNKYLATTPWLKTPAPSWGSFAGTIDDTAAILKQSLITHPANNQ